MKWYAFLAVYAVLLAARPASALSQVMLGFEESDIAQRFDAGDRGMAIGRVAEHATEGSYALKVTFPPFDPKGGWWPSATLKFNPPRDWSAYRTIQADVFNPQSEEAEVGMIVGGWCGYFAVPPQTSRTIEAPLRESASIPSLSFLMRLQVKRQRAPTVFYFDNVRVVPKSVEDPESVAAWLHPPAAGGRLLATVPAKQVELEVTADLPRDQLQALRLRARLGSEERLVPLASQRCTVTFPVPKAETGLQVECLNAEGEVVRAFRDTLRRPPRAKEEVALDAESRCFINGKPFFPIGLYNARWPEDWPELKAMGFNCVGPYFAITKELNVRAKQLGLRILSNVPEKGADSFAEGVKNLDTLLGYYLFDEPAPGNTSRAQLAALCRSVSQVDPYHLTTGCNNDYFEDYEGSSDVMMVDAYPMPAGFKVLIDRITAATKAMDGRGPVWLIPQCFAHEAYCQGDQPNAKGRPPTYDEMRSMIWLGICLGAKGLFFYSHAVQESRTRYAWPIAWQGLAAAVRELAVLSEVVLGQEVKLTTTEAAVYAMARRINSALLVAVVNTAETPQTVTVGGVDSDRLFLLGEPGRVPVRNGKFQDTLARRATRIYVSRSLNLRTPDVAATRMKLDKLQRARDEFYAHDFALHQFGATIETSWGLPTDVVAFAWRRVLDGYRGTSWTVGDAGYFLRRAGMGWPAEKTSRGQRWVEVRLAKPTAINRVAVVSANAAFDLLVGSGEKLHRLTARSSPSREYHQTEVAEVTEAELPPGEVLDRVRLQFTRDAQPGRPELLFEVEAHGT